MIWLRMEDSVYHILGELKPDDRIKRINLEMIAMLGLTYQMKFNNSKCQILQSD